MASFASRTKVDWSVDPDDLIAHASHIAQLVLDKFSREGIEDEERLPLLDAEPRLFSHLRTLAPETLKLLLTNSISPLPLHKTWCSWTPSRKTNNRA